MTTAQLKEEAKQNFDSLVKERDTHQNRINEIETELAKLQGEYRAYEKIMDSGKLPDNANTIKVTPKKENTPDGK